MFLDGYAVLEVIAQSARNTVRRAQRLRDGVQVIIKTSTNAYPTARELRRLEFEYHLLGKLRAPGVIAALGLERSAGRLALVLEDFAGEPLPITPGSGLPLAEFFPLATAIVRALGEVHAKGVIHKDINPRNVLLNRRSGSVKLIDFSLASELSRERTEAVAGSELAGTPAYLSPEQTGRMNRDLDFRTDYYSLGVTLFELLTGSLPFSAPDVLGYVHCHLSKPAPDARVRNAAVPPGLARLVAKLLAKDPEDRYQSAHGLLEDLEHAAACWQETGEVGTFPLGAHDVSDRFQVSQALVGREEELAALRRAFERASEGPASLVLVGGPSGVGKSSLVRELQRYVAAKRGNFVAGKFEQLERNTPYGALLQALRCALKQLLMESEERLLAHRRGLEQAPGAEAAVLMPLLPELARILGAQPPVAELSSREAQARLQRVFRQFLGALATRAQPLVVFLDDLQWSDASTPELLVQLLVVGELRHVLVLGAYRDNEVGDGHVLDTARATLEQSCPDALTEVRLGPLGEDALNLIVAGTLKVDAERGRSLSRLLFEKTAGNPFFLHELLHRLEREGAIRFAHAEGAWAWDVGAIGHASFSANVVLFMLERLQELPAETLRLLQLAACLGNEFELKLLARVAHRTRREVAAALWPAVEGRLLTPRGDEYRLLRGEHVEASSDLGESVRYAFAHDRVVQAAYSLLDEEARAQVHLETGRCLRDEIPAEARTAHVFEFIDHLNLGRRRLSGFEERDELAQFNYLAAQRARRSAAYATAVAYLDAGESTLSDAEWSPLAARRFELARLRAECWFSAGQVERASALTETLFERAPDRLARASVYCLKAQIQEQQSRLAESVATILLGLRELGLTLPEEPALLGAAIGEGLGKLATHLARVPVSELETLPALTDPLRIATTELLFQLIPPASQMNPPLFVLAELILFDLALSHGTVPGSAKNFMDIGIVLGNSSGDYERAYALGKAALAMLERQIPTPLEAAVNFVFGCFISHFGAHCDEGLAALARGHRRGVELGDTLHASYSSIHHAKSLLFAGKPLADCRLSTELARNYATATGAVGHAAIPRLLERSLARLEAVDTPDVRMPDAEFSREIERTGNDHFLFVLGLVETLTHVVLGAWDTAESWSRFAEARLAVGNGSFPVPDYHLFAALLASRRLPGTQGDERASLTARIEGHVATLATFARICPANFRHKERLAATALARAQGAPAEQVLAFHAETLAAFGEGFLHLRALSHELQAEFWREHGQPELARDCLLEAHDLYGRWGAHAKVALLERAHAEVLEHEPTTTAKTRAGQVDTLVTATVTTGVEGSTLDFAAALKASQNIASELTLERLYPVLVQSLLENVGAERGYLLVPMAEGELTLVAHATVADLPRALALPVALDAFEPIVHDLVRYVARTQEIMVLDDARCDEVYRDNLYVRRAGVQALLCLPLVSQGETRAILYAEHTALSRVFTTARLGMLRVLAVQAALAITNAERWSALELELAERMRELAELRAKTSEQARELELTRRRQSRPGTEARESQPPGAG